MPVIPLFIELRVPREIVREGSSGAAALNETTSKELLSVGNDEIFANGILAVVDTASVQDLLGFEGYEDSKGVEQFRVSREHGGLALFRSDGVISVGKADGCGHLLGNGATLHRRHHHHQAHGC